MLLPVLLAAFLLLVGLIVFRRRHLSLLTSLACLLGAVIALIFVQEKGWWPPQHLNPASSKPPGRTTPAPVPEPKP